MPDYLVRDRDRVYGEAFTRRIRAMGIRDRPTAPRSPWQNGYAERLIGSIRRECLDHVIVFGERHLRHVLRSYQQYYNGTRTHLALAKDSPLTRSVQAIGSILPLPILGGLHHRYVRILISDTDTFVAKIERGERRIDVIEFIAIARAIGRDPMRLLKQYLEQERPSKPRSGPRR